MQLFVITLLFLVPGLQGLRIEIDTNNANKCTHRYMQVTCRTSASELGNNKLSITKGSSMMKVTECQRNGMTCTPPKIQRYSAMFHGDDVILKVMNLDYMNDSTTWSCMIGSNKKEMQVKFIGDDPCDMTRPWHEFISFKGTNLINVITLIIAFIILVLLVVHLIYSGLCKRCTEFECPCGPCRKKDEDVEKKGYQGKRYPPVRTSFNVPNRDAIPDASAQKVPSRTDEAKRHCQSFDQEKKELAKKHLEKFVEDRVPPPESTNTPLLSNTSGSKK